MLVWRSRPLPSQKRGGREGEGGREGWGGSKAECLVTWLEDVFSCCFLAVFLDSNFSFNIFIFHYSKYLVHSVGSFLRVPSAVFNKVEVLHDRIY